MTTIARITLEAVAIGAVMLGFFHWQYETAPLPATIVALAAIIIALVSDYFLFRKRRDQKI